MSFTVEQHFEGRSLHVREIYDRILAAAREFGPVEEDPKKTSIHLNRRNAFAGIQTRREFLIVTVKAQNDLNSPRIARREQASANRWHHEIKLFDPRDVDAEIREWIHAAYLISG